MSGAHPVSTVTVDGAELNRLLADPGFFAALDSAWRGQGSLEDAVHWRKHPLTVAPSGRPDPALELRALKARVYARPAEFESIVESRDDAGAPVRLAESEAALLELERRLEHDSHDLDDAIAAARLATQSWSSRLDEPDVPPSRFAWMLRRHPVAMFATAAALLLALVLPVTSVVLAPSLRPSAMLLKVFNRPQSAIDIAPQVFTGGQPGYTQAVRDTTRFLGLYYGVKAFAYRNGEDSVCMLTTAPGDHDVTVCVSTGAFSRSGLTIRDTNYGVTDATAGVTAESRLAFSWGPDTDLSVRIVG
jgi:hypothetical protein